MRIRIPRGWEMPESAVTPEHVWLNRRALMKGAAAGSVLLATGSTFGAGAWAQAKEAEDPSAKLYPVMRNPKYKVERAITDEKVNGQYNNFYEFGMEKEIWRAAQKLPIRPWMIKIDGMVEKPFEIGIDELLAKVQLEERIYRHRCVEGWSMVIPWSGFAVSELVKLAKPTSGAKYLQMETFNNPAIAPGQKQFWYPWPYTEGLTMEEANNELAFLATGTYGHPAAKQHGAPIRLAVPWKYGFKSVKSIVRFHFTDKRPKTYWEALQPKEYGFWANVNPAVDHPRWSQATERVLGTTERIPTVIFNGYGDFVADLYKDNTDPRLYV